MLHFVDTFFDRHHCHCHCHHIWTFTYACVFMCVNTFLFPYFWIQMQNSETFSSAHTHIPFSPFSQTIFAAYIFFSMEKKHGQWTLIKLNLDAASDCDHGFFGFVEHKSTHTHIQIQTLIPTLTLTPAHTHIHIIYISYSKYILNTFS